VAESAGLVSVDRKLLVKQQKFSNSICCTWFAGGAATRFRLSASIRSISASTRPISRSVAGENGSSCSAANGIVVPESTTSAAREQNSIRSGIIAATSTQWRY
jgi:hypothetical protein